MSYDYNYGYNYATPSAGAAEGILAGLGIFYLVFLADCIFLLVCMYKVFKKAGRKGWEALIPIYNIIVMIQIAELPTWYIVLYFIPFANIYAMFKIYIEFAHKFGKSTGFGIAMIFFSYICFPILAFGNAEYQGSVPMNTNYNPNPVPNNGMQQQNMQMNYNQSNAMNNDLQNNGFNVTPNNYSGEVAGLNNQMNNFGQPQVQPAPVNMMETSVSSTPEVQPAPTVVTPVIPVQEVQPTPVIETPESPVAEIQSTPVVEAPVAPVMESVQPTPVVEPVAAQPIASESVVSEPVMTEPVQNKKFCPNCGNQVDQNDAICFMCGSKF